MNLIFERITVRMINRKPYYEIKYIDRGERMTGYGSYSLAVISSYIRQYFILQDGYMWDCPTCGLENNSDFKMDDLREEQEERLGVAPILNPKTK